MSLGWSLPRPWWVGGEGCFSFSSTTTFSPLLPFSGYLSSGGFRIVSFLKNVHQLLVNDIH